MGEELPTTNIANLAQGTNTDGDMLENEDLSMSKDDGDESEEESGDSGGADESEEEDEEEDEDNNNPDSSDDEEDTSFDAIFGAVFDAIADAQVKALSEVNISEFPALVAIVEDELKKQYTPPIPTKAAAPEAEQEGELNQASAFDNAILTLQLALTLFDGNNPLETPSAPSDFENASSFDEFLAAINEHIVSAAPRLLSLIKDASVSEAYRYETISLISKLFFVPSPPPKTSSAPDVAKDARDKIPMLKHLQEFLYFLRDGGLMDRTYILDLLQSLINALPDGDDQDDTELGAEKERCDAKEIKEQVKAQIISAMKEVLFCGVGDDDEVESKPALTTSEIISVIAAFEHALACIHTSTVELFLSAGAFDWVLSYSVVPSTPAADPPYYATSPPSADLPKTLLAVQLCLAAIDTYVKDDDEADKLFFNSSALSQDEQICSTFGSTRNFVPFTIFQMMELCRFPYKRPDSLEEAEMFDAWDSLLKNCTTCAHGLTNESPVAKVLFGLQDGAVCVVVESLGRKDAAMYGTDAEWMLARICDPEGAEEPEEASEGKDANTLSAGGKNPCIPAVQNAFRALLGLKVHGNAEELKGRELSLDDKITLIGGLQLSFPTIQQLAMRAGMSEFIVDLLTESVATDEQKIAILKCMATMMENDQTAGYFLFKDGFLGCLMNLLEKEGYLAYVIPLFSKLLDSYTGGDDSKPVKPEIVKELSSPNVQSTLLALTHVTTDAPEARVNTAGSILFLLGDIVSGDLGTESWGWEDDSGDPPPPCPLKDSIVTAELVRTAIALVSLPPLVLKEEGLDSEKDSPSQASQNALHFLCHACWGYQRGYDLVVAGFKDLFSKPIDAEELWVYSNLDGDYAGRGTSRMRRKVADAAVAADGLARVFELLKREVKKLSTLTPDEDKAKAGKYRRAAVEGLRVLLRSDNANQDLARNNDDLPLLLTHLISEESRVSLDVVQWIMSLLSNEFDFDNSDDNELAKRQGLSPEEREMMHVDKQRWLLKENWKTLGTEEVARHLVNIVALRPYTAEANPPDAEGVSAELHEAAMDKHRELITKAEKIREETTKHVVHLLDIILPVLGSNASILIGPLLRRSREVNDNRDILLLIHRILCTKGITLAPAVETLSGFLSSSNPPPCSQLFEWISVSPRICDVVRQSGAASYLLKILAIDSDTSEEYVEHSGALSALGELVAGTLDHQEKEELQKQIATNTPALHTATKIMCGEDEWDAVRAIASLGQICTGLPSGLSIFDDTDKAFALVLKYFDNLDHSAESIAPLLGQLAGGYVEALTTLLKSYFGALVAPTEQASSGKSDKKKKKKKKYTPRISEDELWTRLALLASTTSSARRAVVDAGALTEAAKLLDLESPTSWKLPMETLTFLVGADEGYPSQVSSLLPRIKELLPVDDAPCTEMRNLIDAYVRVDLPSLISAEVIPTLLRASCYYPLSFEPFISVSRTLHDIAKQPIGYSAIAEHLKGMLVDDDVIEIEKDSSWRTGFAAALKRLSSLGEPSAKMVVEVGGVEYALKLLKYDHIQVISNGAKLSAFLATSSAPIRAQLVDLGCINFVEEGRAKAIQSSQRVYAEEVDSEMDEDTFNFFCRCHGQEAENLQKILAVLKGEVDSYAEDEMGEIL
ncbi:hypothetical protein PLEOSDRAFT_174919 [Pleurotus ostreatus PC15]|uniref:Uncharacterized protein n=1 Tax=Pleurotus ostreatus (strain PC15) TaxID=1137138 RepID=A0A067NEA4_PLEO1|nr:hypothetical protein PLEOSDRAFT_174919 [Pleurotus ostreatus PC15]